MDVAGLEFIGVAGMRAIAEASRANGTPVKLRGASSALQRHWSAAGFADTAPDVELVV